MSKRIPVYLSESELKKLVEGQLLIMGTATSQEEYELCDSIKERLEAELANFEE